MGLDMYLSGRKVPRYDYENRASNRTEDGFNVASINLELAYWRKHADLHGYIVETFAEGVDECQEIELTPDDLTAMIEAIKAGDLPETTGFFFRYEGYDPAAAVAEDIAKLEAALAWVTAKVEGEWRYVVYQASW